MTLPLLARSGCRRQLATQRLLKLLRSALCLLALVTLPAHAQDPGTLNPQPLPPLPNPDAPKTPANELFGRKTMPLSGPPRSIGSYGDGCLAGAVALPISGPSWQVMRKSRNRYWGNPSLVAFIERLADNAKKVGWSGLLIGDIVLRKIGDQVRSLAVLAGRLGGEEFALVVEGRLDDAIDLAERIREAISELAIRAGDEKMVVTCSVGVEPGDSIDSLLRRADVALYEAKRSGRNRVVAADSFPLAGDHDHWRGVARSGNRPARR